VSEHVSVIIPAFDASKYLGEAIDSVVGQSHDRLEIIVVDDGSNDDTAAVAARFGSALRYVYQPHSGPGAARNHGVRVSTGAYLAFLDADDLWESDKLSIQLAAFAADPSLEIVFGHVVQFWSPDLPPELAASVPALGEPMRGDHPGAMLLRRDVFDEVGLFRESREGDDLSFIDWYARALDRDRDMLMLEAVVMRRRLHETNLGRVTMKGPVEYARALRRVVERRRVSDA
jgi:glycosyltransferase involved in cell wall biosynthesis